MVREKKMDKVKGIASHFKIGKTFNNVLQSKFTQLGYLVGLYPSYFIMVPLFLTALGITGIQQINYMADPEYLFAPENGKGKLDRDTIEDLFPVNSSDLFDSSRNTRIANAIRLFAFAKDDGSMIRREQWDELNYVDEVIKNITIEWEGKTLKYEDFCAKKRGKCLKNQILNLNDIMDDFLNNSTVINYPVMLYPFVLPYFYGGPEVDEEKGHLLGAKSVSLLYFSQQGSKEAIEQGRIWEWNVLEQMLNMEFKYLKLSVFGTRSLEDELERNAASMIPYLYVNSVIMVMFSIFTVAAIDWVRSKFYLGIIAVFSSIFGTGAGFGFLMYAQVPFIGINMAIPFLLLGIGLDDQFVVLSAWHRTDKKKSIPERMAQSYTEAASSITITSLTTMLSSFVGTLTPFPSVYYFCLYTGVCVFIQYTWFVCLYGGCLVIAGYAEQSQRHAFTCRPVLPLSMSDDESGCYRIFCSGGISKEDPHNDKDNKNQMIMVFFRDYVATLINKKIAKVIVLFIFFVYILGAIYGIMNLGEGLDRRKMVLDDSYLIDFFDKEDEYYRRLPYRIQVVVNETLNYTDPVVHDNILQMHDDFENMTYVGDTFYTTSWIRHFYRWVDRKEKLKAKITDDASMIKVLEENYFPRRKTSRLDVTYNEDKTQINAIRFIIQTEFVNDTEQDKDMMSQMREMAANQPYNTLVFHQFFVFFDQYLLVRQTAIQAICGAAVVMMVVALIFIPSARSAFAIAFSIVSIEVGVIGYMSLWNVNLDSVSLICLIMCIGFSVDFSAHISYAFITAEADTTEERVRQSLYSLGLPVLQGGASTIMAVAVLSGVPSYIFKIFFKIVFLVIFFGICHALFLLPVILSLLVGDSCKTSKTKDHNNLAQNLQLPKNIQNDLKDSEIRPSSKSENFSDRSTLRAESDSESLSSSRETSVEGGIQNTAFEADPNEKL